MKTIRLVHLLLVVVLISGCSSPVLEVKGELENRENGIPDDLMQAGSYCVLVNIVDASGANKLEGLVPEAVFEGWNGENLFAPIEPSLYKWSVEGPSLSPWYPNGLSVFKPWGDYFLSLEDFRIPLDRPKDEESIHKITIPYVFGDDKEHTFIAYWEFRLDQGTERYYLYCSRMEMDGKEYPVTYETDSRPGALSIAWIVLDD